jgi:hypothetical protein
MSTDDDTASKEVTAAQNYNKRLAQELAEAEANKNQLALDRWWESQREFEAKVNDYYQVGGYLERWSQTPSYTKSRRDRDWRIR